MPSPVNCFVRLYDFSLLVDPEDPTTSHVRMHAAWTAVMVDSTSTAVPATYNEVGEPGSYFVDGVVPCSANETATSLQTKVVASVRLALARNSLPVTFLFDTKGALGL